MRSTLIALLLIFSLSACTSSVDIGGREIECIGAFDDPDPEFVYKTSWWNVTMAIVFFEMAFIPTIMVVADMTRCPVRQRDAHKLPEAM